MTRADDGDDLAARLELQRNIARIARVVGALLDQSQAAGPRAGYCLMLFDYGTTGSFAYAARAARSDVVGLLREAIEKIEGAPRPS